MKQIRYWSRLTLVFLLRYKSFIAIGVVIGLGTFLILSFLLPAISSNKRTIGRTGRFHINELPQDIQSMISDGLTELDEEGLPQPGLALEWESQDEGKTWVFHLDTSRTWHDGTAVTSETVSYNFQDVQVERPDESTIVFKLSDPFAPFPVVVSRPTFKRGLLGTAGWEVTNLSLVSTFVEKIDMKNAEGRRQTIKFFPSEERTKLAFKLGQVNELVDLLDPSPFESWNTTTVGEAVTESRYVGIFFNNTGEVFDGNKSLRQSLSYAVNKTDFGERAIGPVSPMSWAFNPQVKRYEYDVTRASELFDELSDEQKENLTITLQTVPVLLDEAERVAEFWRELGIEVSVQSQSGVPSEFDAFMAIYDIPTDPDQYSIWHSTQEGTNISNFQDPRIDKLLEEGRQELDELERKRIYLDFQKFLLEDAPAIFLYHPVSYSVVRN